MNDLISRQEAIDELNVGAEWLRRALDDADVVSAERAKYEWGLGLIEACISDMKELPSAQQETCEGCKHLDKYENEVEYGYPSPCTCCKRNVGEEFTFS